MIRLQVSLKVSPCLARASNQAHRRGSKLMVRFSRVRPGGLPIFLGKGCWAESSSVFCVIVFLFSASVSAVQQILATSSGGDRLSSRWHSSSGRSMVNFTAATYDHRRYDVQGGVHRRLSLALRAVGQGELSPARAPVVEVEIAGQELHAAFDDAWQDRAIIPGAAKVSDMMP